MPRRHVRATSARKVGLMRKIWWSSARVPRGALVVALACGAALTSLAAVPSIAAAASQPTAPTVLSSSLISVRNDGSVFGSVWTDGVPDATYQVTGGSLPAGVHLDPA